MTKMCQRGVVMSLSPPVIPLFKIKENLVAPVAPPSLPGIPKTEAVKKEKKERRMELVGLENGDPLSTYQLAMLGLKNAISTVPKLVIRYWWQILTVFGIWYFLEYFDVFKFSTNYPTLTPLWIFISKFILLIIFITASYNNFVAKAVYAAILIRVGLPLIGRIRSQGFTNVINEFKNIGPDLKKNWALAENTALSLLIGFLGMGAFVSNYLTRNNRIDKIAVTLALAIALMKALSDSPKSLPFMVSRVVMKDFFVMLLKPSPVRNHHIYVAVSGLNLGFLCSLPFAYLSSHTSDNIGYIVGVIAFIAGVGLFFVKKSPAKG